MNEHMIKALVFNCAISIMRSMEHCQPCSIGEDLHCMSEGEGEPLYTYAEDSTVMLLQSSIVKDFTHLTSAAVPPNGSWSNTLSMRLYLSADGVAAEPPSLAAFQNQSHSLVTSYCQEKFEKAENGANCCLDGGPPLPDGTPLEPTTLEGGRLYPGIRNVSIKRGTALPWNCTSSCTDSIQGVRGSDAWFAPEGANCSSPRIVYVHGGRFEYGSPHSYGYATMASRISHMTGAVVMSVDYPLNGAEASLHRCDQYGEHARSRCFAVEETSRALRYLAFNVPSIHVPGLRDGCSDGATQRAPLLIGGDSVGATVAFLMLNDLNGVRHLIDGAFFWSLSLYVYEWFSEIMNVGMRGTLLPPLFFSAGREEPLYDSIARAAQTAAALHHENEVVLDVYDGMWHCFQQYSQGCGNPADLHLWQGELLWHRTAQFLESIANSGHIPCSTSRPKGYPVEVHWANSSDQFIMYNTSVCGM